jgi:hypothetical protein
MKTLIFTLAILVSTVTMGFSKSKSLGIREQISSQLTSFQSNKSETYNGKALVTFKVNKTGEVKLIDVETNDTFLKQHLETSFQKIKIENMDTLKSEIIYSMNVVLKVV